jgi:hypothetical protein
MKLGSGSLTWVGALTALLFLGCQSKEEGVKLACDSPNQVDNTLPPAQRGMALAQYIDQNVKNGDVLAILGGTEPAAVKGKKLEALAASVGIEECALAVLWSKAPMLPRLPASGFAMPMPHPPVVGSGSVAPREQVQILGDLSIAEVTKVMKSASPAFEPCYVAGLRKDRKLAGVVRARFVVGEDGKATNVEDGGSELADAEVVKCILQEVGKLEFPKPSKGKATVVFPIELRAPTRPSSSAASSAASSASSAASSAAPGTSR